MKSSYCVLGIALLGYLSVGYSQEYEVADFGERMPTNSELVEALTPFSSVETGYIAMQSRTEPQTQEKAKIVLHSNTGPQIPALDMPREPRRITLRDDDSPRPSQNLPQVGQQQGRQKAISLQVQFDYNSTELTPASKAKLDVVASALNSMKLANYKFRVEGHTDSVGSAQYNLKLSKYRAQSVARYLVRQYQVEPGRLQAVGRGMSEPANPANPRAPENRRVVIVNVGHS